MLFTILHQCSGNLYVAILNANNEEIPENSIEGLQLCFQRAFLGREHVLRSSREIPGHA